MNLYHRDYDQILKYRPDYSQAWHNQGVLYMRLGQTEDAIKSFEGEVISKPNSFRAINNLALLNSKLQRHRDAYFWYSKRIGFNYFKDELDELFFKNECNYHKSFALDDPGALFVSYPWSIQDDVKDNVITKFDQLGVEYFFDDENMPQSGNMEELPWRLELGLAKCGAIFIVWCHSSTRSYWMKLELASAIAMLKNVIILSLDETPVPIFLNNGIQKGLIRVLRKEELTNLSKPDILYKRPLNSFELDQNNRNLDVKILEFDDFKIDMLYLTGGLLKNFFVSTYPVTQEQWVTIMGNNPSKHPGDLTRPVENVSWNDVIEFIKILNAKSSKKFRLLSDVEWEFVCRTGSTSNWSYGDDEDLVLQNAWCRDNTYIGSEFGYCSPIGCEEGLPSKTFTMETSPYQVNSVFTKKPNAWGVSHMHGNVYEWCEDISYNGKRLIRGGSYATFPRDLRCSERFYISSEKRCADVGFRVCMDVL